MRRAIWMCVCSSTFGALVMYLFDHERGRRRRNVLRDRLTARFRRAGRMVGHLGRAAAADTYALAHRMRRLGARSTDIAVDDETLCRRVESQLFRDRHVRKGDLNINCEYGVVILRGELDSPADIADVEKRVRRIPGVRGVQNLLHPHGTPAPNKERSRAVSQR
jgi:hypothetical protein